MLLIDPYRGSADLRSLSDLTWRRDSASSSGSTAPPMFYQVVACSPATNRQKPKDKTKNKKTMASKDRVGAPIHSVNQYDKHFEC